MYCRNKKEGPVFHANIHKGKFKLILHEHIQNSLPCSETCKT